MDRLSQFGQPCYALFQKVRVVADLEDRQMDDIGFITGIFLDIDNFPESRWFYQVLFWELPFEPWLSLPHLDQEVLESEIHPVEPLSESVAH
jgi:hypothetical protein